MVNYLLLVLSTLCDFVTRLVGLIPSINLPREASTKLLGNFSFLLVFQLWRFQIWCFNFEICTLFQHFSLPNAETGDYIQVGQSMMASFCAQWHGIMLCVYRFSTWCNKNQHHWLSFLYIISSFLSSILYTSSPNYCFQTFSPLLVSSWYLIKLKYSAKAT